MKVLLLFSLLISVPVFSKENYDRRIHLTRLTIDDLEKQKSDLEEIYAGASRLAKIHTAAKWLGLGIPAFYVTTATTGFIGVMFGSFGALEYGRLDKNQYKDLKEILATDFFSPSQKEVVHQYSKAMQGIDEKKAIQAEINLLTLINKQTNEKMAEELKKEEYNLESGSYLSRPQKTANYLDLKISLITFNLAFQNKILEKLEELEKL